MIALYAALGAFFSAYIRGAAIDHYFKKYHKFGNLFLKLRLAKIEDGETTLRFTKPINATAFGIAAYFVVHNYLFAALIGLGMFVGQAPAIFKNEIDSYYKNRQYLDWSLIVLERALVWVLPLLLVSIPFTRDGSLWWLLAVPVMPIAYSVMFCEWLHTRVNRWALAEAIFGSCLWGILVLM